LRRTGRRLETETATGGFDRMHVSTLSSMRGSPSTRLLKSHAQHKPARTNAPRRAHSQIVAQRDARAVEQQRVGRQPAGLAGMWRTAVTTAAALTVLGGSGGGVLPAHAATELNPLAKVFQEDVAKLREEREVRACSIEPASCRLHLMAACYERRRFEAQPKTLTPIPGDVEAGWSTIDDLGNGTTAGSQARY
jgi:hypothetical protein